MGVWIEIRIEADHEYYFVVTPCVGVWIEISVSGVIEMLIRLSLPAWECGLKLQNGFVVKNDEKCHSLRGSVD